jgi:hypothetical protein
VATSPRGNVTVNFDINNGGIAGFGEFYRDGVQAGQTKGTMKLWFTFPGMNFRSATNVPIKISLVTQSGMESNEVVGTFSVQ